MIAVEQLLEAEILVELEQIELAFELGLGHLERNLLHLHSSRDHMLL